MKKVIIKSFCICSILLFCLTGCNTQKPKDIKDKLNAELQYVEDLIFKIANKHAKGEYLEEDGFNWKLIKEDVNKINNSWGNLVLDLTNVNVPNSDIMDFSNNLNDLLIAISKENDVTVIEKLSNMYEKVIVFKEVYSENKNQIAKNKIKSGALKVYSLVNQAQWTAAKTEIEKVVEEYKKLMNDIQYAEENSYHLNKVYVLLEEYRVSIETQNFDLTRMKYIVTVEDL